MAEKEKTAEKFVVAKSFHEPKGNKNIFYGHEREGRSAVVSASDFKPERWDELIKGGFVKPAKEGDK